MLFWRSWYLVQGCTQLQDHKQILCSNVNTAAAQKSLRPSRTCLLLHAQHLLLLQCCQPLLLC
jgi:hypothetical protein